MHCVNDTLKDLWQRRIHYKNTTLDTADWPRYIWYKMFLESDLLLKYHVYQIYLRKWMLMSNIVLIQHNRTLSHWGSSYMPVSSNWQISDVQVSYMQQRKVTEKVQQCKPLQKLARITLVKKGSSCQWMAHFGNSNSTCLCNMSVYKFHMPS
jgi:hypothetical protein